MNASSAERKKLWRVFHKYHVSGADPASDLHTDARGRVDLLLIGRSELQSARSRPDIITVIFLSNVPATNVGAGTRIDNEDARPTDLVWFSHWDMVFIRMCLKKPLHAGMLVIHVHVRRPMAPARVLAARGCGDNITTPVPWYVLYTLNHVDSRLMTIIMCSNATCVRGNTPGIPFCSP